MYAIYVNNLKKMFPNEIVAVNSVSFNVEEGEIFGMLGPNGAGKTTTIRMITTLTKPTSGDVTVLGVNAVKNPSQVRRMLGYVPQAVSVDGDLSAYENLLIFSKLFHVERNTRKKLISEALAYMGLTDRENDLVKHFSGGMMRRLEIAQALVNRPKILFLDEPSIGLDPTSKRQGWEYIKRLNQEFGVTIFITTHDMVEADELCDRVAIMNRGQIAVLGTPSELKSSISGDLVTLELSTQAKNLILPREIGSIVSSPTGEDGDSILRIQVDSAEHAIPKVMDFFSRSGLCIESISFSKPNLDDVFTKYTKATLTEDQGKALYKEARSTRRSFARHSG
ncbi:MAG: ATP-binding cassette domain-containing protein [Nitrososphaerota archaeon]|nr:ATP-binding cassette domain-containing protein [Nitrososphaerota archaeon]